MPADWQEVRIAKGATESEVLPIPADAISVPPGQVRKADGSKFHGRDRPRFDVEEIDANSSRIVLDFPADEDVVFKVKREEEEDPDVDPDPAA